MKIRGLKETSSKYVTFARVKVVVLDLVQTAKLLSALIVLLLLEIVEDVMNAVFNTATAVVKRDSKMK